MIYIMEQTIQAFTLGKSTVVTIPKSLGVKPGTKMKIQKKGKIIVLKPEKKEDAAAIVQKLAGGMNFKKVFGKSLTPEDINKLIDEQYEHVLPR